MKQDVVLGLTGLERHSSHFHDSSACMTDKGEVVGAVAEGRFTRNRHHAGFPWMGVNYLLGLGCSYSDIDAVAMPWPVAKGSGPLSVAGRVSRILSAKKAAFSQFLPIEKKRLVGIGHQRAHASSAYRTSGFKKALVVALDTGGPEEDVPDAQGAIFVGENGELTRVCALTSGFGLFYAFITEGLGFGAADGEAKTMSLAAYGDSHTKAYNVLACYAPTVKGVGLRKPKKDFQPATAVINNYQRFSFGNIDVVTSLSRRFSDRDVAAAAQRILEERVVELVDNAMGETGMDKLCLAGEVFLNVKLNKKLKELKRVRKLYTYPHAGDTGTSVGAALEAHHTLTGKPTRSKSDGTVYLGPDYSDAEVRAVLSRHRRLKLRETSDPAGYAAELICMGKVVGWFQGRMEWSPRALGARSVLSAPHDVKIKERLNIHKQRESFMPYSPSMLLRDAYRYLKSPSDNPYMTMAYDVLPHARDEIAAVVHVDDTVRPQTVKRQQNPLYYDLIREYDKMTGTAAVLNTSFNRFDLPIVCRPEDAVQHLLMKGVDALVIGNLVAELK